MVEVTTKYRSICGAIVDFFTWKNITGAMYTAIKNPMVSRTSAGISFVSHVLCLVLPGICGGDMVEVTTKYRGICGATVDFLPGRTLRVLYGY